MCYVDLRYLYDTTGANFQRYVDFDNANRPNLWKGWLCPRCGTVWSPSILLCTCKRVAVTTGSTTGTLEEMANDPNVRREMADIAEEFAVTDNDGLEDLP